MFNHQIDIELKLRERQFAEWRKRAELLRQIEAEASVSAQPFCQKLLNKIGDLLIASGTYLKAPQFKLGETYGRADLQRTQ